MAVQPSSAVMHAVLPSELQTRQVRWRSFQVIFSLTYIGIVLDVLTTSLGIQKVGASYEQNPMGLALISHLGWIGLLMVLTAVCLFCYVSCREVAWRMSPRWIMLVNLVLLVAATVRWLAVVTAVLYIASLA